MRWKITAALCGAMLLTPAYAQSPSQGPTTNLPVKITTGNTFQLILPAGTRRSVTVQNNQTTTDNCWVIPNGNGQIVGGTTTLSTSITLNGVSLTAQQASILLTPGLPWQRYFPIVPNDAIYGTCATTGDSLYIDTQ